MLSNSNSVLKTGDWIKRKSREGEFKVNVITSDYQETVGKTIPILSNQVKSLSVSNVINKEQILFLIDLALSIGDENWFIQLSSKLNSIN
jgi:IDEAL domain